MSAAFLPNIDMDPLEYGYLSKYGKFLPDMECQELPDDFPIPYSCLRCARANICPCRRKLIPCCTFGKCSKNNACKNDFNYRRATRNQGRRGFVKLGHFDKHFVKNSRKKAGKISEFFLLDTLKIHFKW